MDDWESQILQKIHELELNRHHIVLLRIRLYNNNYKLTQIDDEAFECAVKGIEQEIKRLKADLTIEQILKDKI